MKRTWPAVLGLVIMAAIVGSCLASGGSAPNAASPTTSSLTPDQKWIAANGSTFSALASDTGTLQKDALASASSSDFTTVAADCQTLGSDVGRAQSVPAVPDPTAEGEWSSILTNLASAAQDCTNGIAQNDPSLIDQMGTEITTANTQESKLDQTLGVG